MLGLLYHLAQEEATFSRSRFGTVQRCGQWLFQKKVSTLQAAMVGPVVFGLQSLCALGHIGSG